MTIRADKQAELNRIQQEIAKLQRELVQIEKDLANSRANPALEDLIPSQERTLQRTKDSIAVLEKRAADVEAQIAAIPDEPPAQSAAADVAASADGATQNPAPAPVSTGRLTTEEAATLAQNTETGTNPPVKPLTETQSVPPANTGNETEGRPSGEPGVGAAGEDGSTASNTRQVIAAAQAKESTFAPRDNVLDQYASYTYNIGWYLMTPEQYTALQKTGKMAVGQYNLLIQSGGAPSSVDGVQPDLTSAGAVTGVSKSAGRNPFFGLDYYFDNLVIKSKITGKGTGSAHNAVDISFTVTETAGITLIDNLAKAVKSAYKDTGVAYISAVFALVIRFYGYDENGKIVQASDSDNKNAVVEKIIPFKLKDIQFTVSNKLVEYQVQAVPVSYQVGFGSSLGTVKAGIQISGATVKDLMTKGSAPPAVSPADGRKPTPTPAKPTTPPAAASTTTPQTLIIDGSAGQEVGGGTISEIGVAA